MIHIEQSDFHDQLMRGLTHKMNNILSLFHGYLGLIIDDKKLDSATRDGLSAIREGAAAASELMDRTKAFAKPSRTVLRHVDIADFLRMMIPALESFAERGVRLEFDFGKTLPPMLVDASRLRTAVMEVVRNACEASPEGGVVRISARAESHLPRAKSCPEASGDAARPITWIVLTVSDEGGGVAPEIGKKIFQPFFSTKQKRNAMGLGLSVAQGLVQGLGGVIRFQSKAGKTSFRILLPPHS